MYLPFIFLIVLEIVGIIFIMKKKIMIIVMITIKNNQNIMLLLRRWLNKNKNDNVTKKEENHTKKEKNMEYKKFLPTKYLMFFEEADQVTLKENQIDKKEDNRHSKGTQYKTKNIQGKKNSEESFYYQNLSNIA